MIVGVSGSGKTAMAKELSLKLDLPQLVPTEKLHRKGNWRHILHDEFLISCVVSVFGEQLTL